MIYKSNPFIKFGKRIIKKPGTKKRKTVMPKKINDLRYEGHVYASRLEIRIVKRLFILKKAKLIKDFEPHYKTFTFVINGIKAWKYTPDFKIITLNDSEIVIDVKGYRPTPKKKAAPKGWAVFRHNQKLMKILFNITVEVVTNEIELMKLLKI